MIEEIVDTQYPNDASADHDDTKKTRNEHNNTCKDNNGDTVGYSYSFEKERYRHYQYAGCGLKIQILDDNSDNVVNNEEHNDRKDEMDVSMVDIRFVFVVNDGNDDRYGQITMPYSSNITIRI